MKRYATILALFFTVYAIGAQAFIINNGSEPKSLDPSLIEGDAERRLSMALFEGLVINDPKSGGAIPGVAEKWTISPDGAAITFTLRKSEWSDGTPVTASDFVKGWLRTLSPETAAECAPIIGAVVKGAAEYHEGKAGSEVVALKALNDLTLEVGLARPMAHVLDTLTHYAFFPLPTHVIGAKGAAWADPLTFVGNGAFVLKEWKPSRYILVEKNSKYWDARTVKLSTIRFLPIEDAKIGYLMYKLGDIDWQTEIPLDIIEELKLRKDFQTSATFDTYASIFNMTRKPFDDPNVRMAFAMSIDKKALVDRAAKLGEQVAESLTPPLKAYAVKKSRGFAIEEAKKLLVKAGYPDGQGFPSASLVFEAGERSAKIAQFAQAQWKKNLGIEVELRPLEKATFMEARSNAHDFDMVLTEYFGANLDPYSFLERFLSGMGDNFGLYSNAKFDELVKKAAAMKGGAERLKSLAEAETILMEQDQALIPLFHPPFRHLIDVSKWNGWFGNPADVHNWKFISHK